MTTQVDARDRPGVLGLLFGLDAPVDRATYARWGFGLMALKYSVDALVVYAVANVTWTPLDYLSPLRSTRDAKFGHEHNVLQLGMLLWTLPFLWIGVGMTMRRGVDAGIGAGLAALLYFAPIFNYVWMLALCAAPSQRVASASERRTSVAAAPGEFTFERVAKSVAAAIAATCIAFAISVLVFRSYGSMVFLGAPVLLGVVGAVAYNRRSRRPLKESIYVALIASVFAGATLVLFAAEGLMCIAMTLPLTVPMSVLGACLGHGIASLGPPPSRATATLLPIVWCGASWLEQRFETASPGCATTSIRVAAPRETVWKHVVSFSELPPPNEFYFRLGIAFPIRARIEGQGVGAVRRCEFSTGPFVEPITAWEEPAWLAFDVVDEPAALVELSPFDDLAPPHLDGFFSSKRGEFRLHEAADAATQLDGTTWYELRLEPAAYWRLWSDSLVHRIHSRVLTHIRSLAEQERAEK